MKRALIIINPMSRQGEAGLQTVREILHLGGIASMLVIITNVRQIRDAIRSHIHEIDRIIVGGGDGTLNAALEPVLRTGLTLGVLPLGTANDLARTLQIPSAPEDAARVIAGGRTKKIDLGWVNNKHYLNVASIGMAVKVRDTLTTPMKKRWGVLAYPLSLRNAYRDTRPFRARIICEGRTHDLKSIQIAVGNGRHYGGGLSIRHDAAIDDHLLNLYSLKPRPLWDLLRAAPAIMKGTMQQGELVRLMDGREIRVITRRPMPITADGEAIAYTPAHFLVKSSMLPVFVP